jgi:diaminohydroxyphosphoribosylaminopyrimidine deaminase/5-amino-6-(5-phosphoribosylamino)uracil reductase
LSDGFTQRTGGNHAERQAYENWKSTSIPHNLYVTLEPCTHWGKTPPCLDIILEKRPQTVYIGISDPNPLVAKRNGIRELRNQGIEVQFDPKIEKISESFLNGFLERMKNQSPEVILKISVSREGYYSPKSKKRLQISSYNSSLLTQLLRSKVDAILVGPATVQNDSPGLDFRGIPYESKLKIETYKSTDPFWRILSETIGSEFLQEESQSEGDRYQPTRVFVLKKSLPPRVEFWEKQEILAQKFGKRKILFLAIDSLETDTYRKIEKISDHEVYHLQEYSWADIFAKFQWNRILVEGGNYLYEQFHSYNNLTLLKIQSPKDLHEGLLPILPNLDQTIFQADVGGDTWTVHRRD